MALTDTCFTRERAHFDGVQRIYTLPNGYKLSLVNAPMLHAYPFAWEAAVMNPNGALSYSTPLTDDVEVFMSDEDANEFIQRAIDWASANLEG